MSTAILFSIGFVKQHIILEESFLFEIDTPEKGNINSLRNRQLRKSIFGQYPIFTENAFSILIPIGNNNNFDAIPLAQEWSFKLPKFPTSVLENLICLLYHHEKYLTAATILVEASKTGLELQGANLGVALETIKDQLKPELPLLKGQLDDSVWQPLMQTLLNVKEIINLPEDEKAFIEKKITGLNTTSNRKLLTQPFDYFGIHLNKQEIDAIDRRNVWLHGKLVLTMNSIKWDKEVERCKTIHRLACTLLLKLAGFSGYIIDNTFFDKDNVSESEASYAFIKI